MFAKISRNCTLVARRMGGAKRNPSLSLIIDRSFSKLPIQEVVAAAPIGRVNPAPYIFMKCGVRPIGNSRHQLMSCRVEMDIIKVTLQILFIPHGMFPKPALPDPAFTLRPHKRSGANWALTRDRTRTCTV